MSIEKIVSERSPRMSEKYREEVKRDYKKQLDLLREELPFIALKYLNSKSQSLEISSVTRYAEDLRVYFRWLSLENPMCRSSKDIPDEVLQGQTASDIEEFLLYLEDFITVDENGKEKHHTLSASSRARKLAALKSFYKYLAKIGFLENGANPASLVESIKVTKTKESIVVISEPDKKKMFNLVDTGNEFVGQAEQIYRTQCLRDKAILCVLLGTGIRVSELVGLDLQDIDFEESKLSIIRKGGNFGQVYFNREVADALHDYIDIERNAMHDIKEKDRNALFISRKKGRITVRAVEYLVEKYSNVIYKDKVPNYVELLKPVEYDAEEGGKKKAKYRKAPKLHKISPHKLRSTFASDYVNSEGSDIQALSEVMGHSSAHISSKYYSRSSEMKKRSVADSVHLQK